MSDGDQLDVLGRVQALVGRQLTESRQKFWGGNPPPIDLIVSTALEDVATMLEWNKELPDDDPRVKRRLELENSDAFQSLCSEPAYRDLTNHLTDLEERVRRGSAIAEAANADQLARRHSLRVDALSKEVHSLQDAILQLRRENTRLKQYFYPTVCGAMLAVYVIGLWSRH